MASDYHHGDLPVALRAAAVEVIAENGPASFSLREVARRAGVSHAAPAHHFGDARGLLTSVAAEGFATLTNAMRAAAAEDGSARDRFTALGRAYLQTALDNPGHYNVMIRRDYIDSENPELLTNSVGAYEQLLLTIEQLRDEYNPELNVDATATLVWASVHGLVELAPLLGHVAESTGTTDNTLETLIENMADTVIDGIKRR